MKSLLALLFCLCLFGCADDLRFVTIQYNGYSLPEGYSVWLEGSDGKLKVLERNRYSWSGYFRKGGYFTVTIVYNNKKFLRKLYTVIINNVDHRVVTCDEKLLTCEERL